MVSHVEERTRTHDVSADLDEWWTTCLVPQGVGVGTKFRPAFVSVDSNPKVPPHLALVLPYKAQKVN